MKFTEKDAFDELKRQLKSIVGEPAINDKAITETVATLLPLVANDDMELNDFAVRILPVLKTHDGSARKYASGAVKKREKELAEAKAEAENAEVSDATPPSQAQDETMQKLLARIEALEGDKRAAEQKAKVEAKRAELGKAIEAKGVKDKEWIKDMLSEVTVSEDMDVEGSVDKYVRLYNRSNADTPGDVTPGGAGGTKDENPFADVVESRKARGVARGEVKVG